MTYMQAALLRAEPKTPTRHFEAVDLPCGCCVDVTEERGGHWWRFLSLGADFLCRKARRMSPIDQLNHWREGYAKQKEVGK